MTTAKIESKVSRAQALFQELSNYFQTLTRKSKVVVFRNKYIHIFFQKQTHFRWEALKINLAKRAKLLLQCNRG